jgi:hypothetical protein
MSSIRVIRSLSYGKYTLGDGIDLNISVIVLAGPNEASFGLDHVSDHIIDKPVLIPNLILLKEVSVRSDLYTLHLNVNKIKLFFSIFLDYQIYIF